MKDIVVTIYIESYSFSTQVLHTFILMKKFSFYFVTGSNITFDTAVYC